MIRLSKMADYGIVLLTHVVQAGSQALTARELAERSGLPLPTVSKLLKALCRGGLLASARGARGGYSLARAAAAISVVEMIAAIDGPIAITACSEAAPGLCGLEHTCPVRSNWQRINQVVVRALGQLSLHDMQRPAPAGIQSGTAASAPLPATAAPRAFEESERSSR